MPNSMLPRRQLLCASLGFAATYELVRKGTADTLPPTPAQTAGPFYPATFPQDADNDLCTLPGIPAPHMASPLGSPGASWAPTVGYFPERGSRFGNAMRTVGTTTSGTVGRLIRAMRISRDTERRRPMQPGATSFLRSDPCPTRVGPRIYTSRYPVAASSGSLPRCT
jgi:hypothetical protein